MFAYEQCLLCMGHHSDIWIEAAAYLEMSSRLLTEKGVSFRHGHLVLSIIHTAYCEMALETIPIL